MNVESQIISQQLQKASINSLWCADENAHNIDASHFKGTAITNRFDIYTQLKAQGINCHFNNFDFDCIAKDFDEILFRIAKEKAINFHVIAQACKRLKPEGVLTIFGGKNEGIKRYAKLVKSELEATVNIQRFKNQFQQLSVSHCSKISPNWLNPAYGESQQLTIDGLSFFSQFAVFGWDKIDQGSAMLMDTFAQYIEDNKTDKDASKLLDLGCGYGYLSIRAKQLGFNHIDATDNNAAAIEASLKNFQHYAIEGEVISDDCGSNISKHYDIILSNPPFHKGFDHHKDISQQFIQNIHRLLTAQGQAFIVCNQFVGIEKLSQDLFSSCQLIAQDKGFKVIALKL